MALRTLLAACLVTLCFSCSAAPENYEFSKPVDLPLAGVNKVLQMRNGNTVLFHFEPTKGIIIKIFDSSRKEIASRKELCRYLDINTLKNATFQGLFDINGEAVLFFDQENVRFQHCLIRLRFNASNTKLIEEKVVGESKSRDKTMKFYIMKNKDEDNYALLFSTVKNYPKTCDIFLVYFNKNHESVREVQLDVDRRKYDFMEVTGANALPGGCMVAICMYKLLLNGTVSHEDEFDPTANVYSHHVKMLYVPRDSGATCSATIDVSDGVYPFHAYATYNPFAGSINTLLLGYKDAVVMYGLEFLPTAIIDNILLKTDTTDFSLHPTWINNTMASACLRHRKDTSAIFKGVPVAFFTNEYGLSTLVSEAFTRYKNIETLERPNLLETYLGNIAITQVDDDGKEIWGTVLPKAQYYKSYNHYYYANQLGARWNQQVILGDDPEQVYTRQFLSFSTYSKGRNIYVIYNDDDKNFNRSLGHGGDTIFSFDRTNACYYSINSKKEVTKNYVFGTPGRGEYKTCFVEGADFDDRSGTYAALIQYKKGDDISLRMAWSRL